MAIIKITDGRTNSTLLIKLKFMCNKAVLEIKNVGKDTMILNGKEMTGVVDIISLGYYKIKQGILQQNLSQVIIGLRKQASSVSILTDL